MRKRAGMSAKKLVAAAIGGLIAVSLALWGISAWKVADERNRMKERVLDATVYIETTHRDGRNTFGSGFFFTPNADVMTNWHVVENAESIRIKTRNDVVCDAEIYLYDRQNDAAHLKVFFPPESDPGRTTQTKGPHGSPHLKLRSAPARVGEKILAVGAPWGFRQTVSEGTVSAVAEDPERGTHIRITAGIAEGSSGGPVVDMKGNVVGMATLIYVTGGGNWNYALASPVLAEFIADERGLTAKQRREMAEMREIETNPLLARREKEKNKEIVRRSLPAIRERFPNISFDGEWGEDYVEWVGEISRPGILQESVPPSVHRWGEGYARVRGTRPNAAVSTEIPSVEGLRGIPWGSSPEAARKHRPWFRIFTSRGQGQKILIYTEGTYTAFACEGIFNIDYVFYDGRLGKVEYTQHPEDDRDIAQALIEELSALYGVGPYREADPYGIFHVYVWDRGNLRVSVSVPDPNAPNPAGSTSFWLPIVRFDYLPVSGACIE